MDIEFGRRISYKPLLIILLVSILIGYFIYTFSNQIAIAILFGVICFIVGPLLYSINLSNLYGYWKIDENGIQYCDYSTFGKRMSAILFPFGSKESTIKFDEIESSSVFAGKGIQAPDWALGGVLYGYTPNTILNRFPSEYYFDLKLKNDQEINLDLSQNIDDDTNIENTIKLLKLKTGQQVKLITQS